MSGSKRYNEAVEAKTLHIYRSDGAWAVKKEGKSARSFSTRRKAVDAAKESVKEDGATRIGRAVGKIALERV
jgi:hypothetical protein